MHASLATGSFRSDTTFRDDPWRLCFPNFADTFPFDYPKLVGASYAEKVPLGTLKEGIKKRVAVIGAGIAGTQAARELARAGFDVDLYEYTNRIGGRTYSTRVPATATTDGSIPKASLTSYEMGAMRIPFFNQYSPKSGPGPHVGGPYNNDELSCTSMSELYALQYRIATTTFPNPGRGELPLMGGAHVDGTTTGIYVSDGFGVDITTFYSDAMLEFPTHRFVYSWPAITSPLENWPASDPHAKGLVRFYNKGTPLMSLTPINIQLDHPLPMKDSDIPPVFLDTSTNDDDETRALNIAAWRKGVTAIRIISYKWTVFANAVRFTFLGDRSRYINPQAALHEDIFKNTQYNNNRTCGKCGCEETSDHVGCRLWDKFWRNKVMPRYQNVTFFEFATSAPVLPNRDPAGRLVAPIAWADGNFGGLGMSGPEAQLFYTIGAGDGSWGAFFPNSSLWALRALLFGFAQEHQLILGCLDDDLDDIHQDPVGDGSLIPDNTPDTTPLADTRKTFKDSNGKEFVQPQFAGVNSFSECHFFKPLEISVDGSEDGVGEGGVEADTLWKRVQSGDGSVRLFTSCKVTGLKAAHNSIVVTTAEDKHISYDHAICTVPLWNINEMDLINFTPKSLSTPVKLALDISHWIRSAKVFVALKEPFWQQGGAADPRTGKRMLFPQVMSTSSILRDVYGIVAPTGSNPYPIEGGMALISYTWEDDAQKFTAYESEDLVKMMLKRVEVLFSAFPEKDENGNARPKFADFMLDPTLNSPGSYKVWQWSKQPSYHGCAKAYQTGIEDLSFALLTHNRTNARRSRLYFAGDAYSMESGWMEPAQRMSLDAVLNLLDHDEDVTMGRPHGFDFATDYLHPSAMSASQSSLTKPLGTLSESSRNQPGELPSAWGRSMSTNNLLRKRSSASILTFIRTNSMTDDSQSEEGSPASPTRTGGMVQFY